MPGLNLNDVVLSSSSRYPIRNLVYPTCPGNQIQTYDQEAFDKKFISQWNTRVSVSSTDLAYDELSQQLERLGVDERTSSTSNIAQVVWNVYEFLALVLKHEGTDLKLKKRSTTCSPRPPGRSFADYIFVVPGITTFSNDDYGNDVSSSSSSSTNGSLRRASFGGLPPGPPPPAPLPPLPKLSTISSKEEQVKKKAAEQVSDPVSDEYVFKSSRIKMSWNGNYQRWLGKHSKIARTIYW